MVGKVPRRRLRKNAIPSSPVRMLSVRAIAQKYGFHENTVRRWVNDDKLRNIRYGPGNKIYIAERDVNRFIKKFYEY
jgi:transposase